MCLLQLQSCYVYQFNVCPATTFLLLTVVTCWTTLPVCTCCDRRGSVLTTVLICSELRLKDIERVQKQFESVKALEKRGLSKEQKEELVICQKVLEWLESGKDIR